MKTRCSTAHGRTIALAALIMLSLSALPAQEGGGQGGADFLLNPSAPRADAMGGVLDGQGDPLEGMLFNPSVLMLDPNILLNVGITPFPNGVTDAALTFGLPIGPGMFGVAAQLVSLGEFTYINAVGQPQGSVTVLDTATSAGYAMYVWDHLSVGGSAKFVFRSLGDYSAFGAGIDAGATWWFETPHVGQRPKPPTMEQLKNQFNRELAAIESEKERRTREAAGDVADLRDDAGKLQEDLDGFQLDLAEAEPDADTSGLEERIAATEASLEETNGQLAAAEAAAADDLAAVERWYTRAVRDANEQHDARVADLLEIESERARLFEVVDNPDAMLTAEDIVALIADAIARTREFAVDQNNALRDANTAFRNSRQRRIDEIAGQIATYESQIADIAGEDAARLRREVQNLQAQIAELEAAETPDAERIDVTEDELSSKQNELDELENDPWIRRLQRRIEDKQEQTAGIQSAIEKFDADTAAALEDVAVRMQREVDEFAALSEDLQTQLLRAQLRRSLDLIDARTERATLRSEARYETTEQKIYATLLSAVYGNEERIFASRADFANRKSDDRRFEFDNRLATQREAEEDEFAFQERFLTQRITELNRTEPVDTVELESTQAELATLQEEHDRAMADFEGAGDSFDARESRRLREELAGIRAERQKVRLIYLQTDDPYRNTAVSLSLRNVGTNLRFATEGYPMPRTVAMGGSYGIVNTDDHSVRVSTELEVPLYGYSTFENLVRDVQVGVGLEYGFADIVEVRAGYGFGTPDRSFSAGVGVDFTLGFTNYAVDYSFRPIPEYGILNTIGVAIGF